MNELKQQLRDLLENQVRHEKVGSMITHAQLDYQEKKEICEELAKALSKEEMDVAKLEKLSFSSILYTAMGKKAEQINKEQEEAYRARVKYQLAESEMRESKYQLDLLEQEWIAGRNHEHDIKALKEKIKEKMIAESIYSDKLMELDDRLEEANAKLVELKEAQKVGARCRREIEEVEKKLSSASSWATFDMFGGGVMADVIKHEKIDAAQAKLQSLERNLVGFQRELADVDLKIAYDTIKFTGTDKFFDMVFDNIFTDMSISSRVKDALANIRTLESKVDTVMCKLEDECEAVRGNKRSLEEEISKIISV